MEWPTAQILRAHANEKWRTTTEYDGERISVIPPNGGTPTTTITDAQGRTVEIDQYKGDDASGDHDAVHYTYDPAGRLGTVKDAAGSTWTYHYDLIGRQSQADDPDKGTTTFTYNNRDLVETVTDARHHKLFFTYDELARKTAEYENDTNGFKLAEWAYDTAVDATTGKPDLGQPASSTRHVKQSDGSIADYVNAVGSYDDAYRPKTTSVTIPSAEGKLAGTYSTTTEYNLDGTLYRTTIPRAGGLPTETLTYGYDELGDVKTLQGLSTYVTGSTYDKIGQLIQQMMWTGGSSKRLLRTNTIDDGTNRLMQTTDEKETAPTPVDNVNYKYDDAGKVTKIADTPTGQTPDVQCFSYDHLQRLSEAWTATDDCAAEPTKDSASSIIGGASPYWQSFKYDAVGDRTSSVDHDVTGATAKDVTQTYTYPAADQPHPHSLSSVTTTGGARDGQTDSFTYDDDGNTKTRQIGSSGPQQQPEQDFTWDLEGHLSSVDKGGQTTSFVYDADGNRLIQHAPDASTLYLAGEEVRLAAGANAATCTRYYSFGGQTIAARTTASLTWLVSDPHGTSDVSVSDDATQTVTRRRFTPFGQIRGDQPTAWPGTRGFVGGTIDTALGGLTQLGAREYDTNTGRFLSVDPVFDQSDPQSWNGYAYADNDPATRSDPSGLHIPTCSTPGECYPTTTGGGNNDNDGHSDGPHYSPPAPTQHHCSWLCGARNSWNKHKATIVNVTVTIVVTAGCEAATGGAGSLGCAVVGGMAGSYAGYAVSTPPDQQTLGGALKAEVVGAITAAATWGVAKGGSALLGKVTTTAAGRVASKAIASAASKAKGAVGKAASAVARGEEDGAGGEVSAGAKAATHDTPHATEEPSSPSGCNSFVPGTKVLLANGKSKKIEDVKVGDKVLATDPKTGKTSAKRVIASFGGVDYKNLIQITVDTDGKRGNRTGIIIATEHHLFWNKTKRLWTRADHLTAGLNLRAASGTPLRVVGIAWFSGHPAVRDLTVSGTHTYYVLAGATPVLVHNCGKDQGIYEFPDMHNPGKTYVGKSINLTNRLGDHLRSGRLASMDDVKITHVCGCEDDVFVAEHLRIQQLRKQGVPLSNDINSPGKTILDRRNRPMLPGAEEWGQ
ncbi:hypothetical protein GCM10023196_034940 [Actinoallomurus vinaceus]|uniref:Hint domain-containing protein n=1 Tax=Actinoallomurus vinaceus TaxID=1080074 RepID=A0ABP8UDA3_9ACTN